MAEKHAAPGPDATQEEETEEPPEHKYVQMRTEEATERHLNASKKMQATALPGFTLESTRFWRFHGRPNPAVNRTRFAANATHFRPSESRGIPGNPRNTYSGLLPAGWRLRAIFHSPTY